MSEATERQLRMWLLGALFVVTGSMASLLWSQQQGIIQQLSDRIGRMEVSCRAT